jgi:hypothetical protein
MKWNSQLYSFRLSISNWISITGSGFLALALGTIKLGLGQIATQTKIRPKWQHSRMGRLGRTDKGGSELVRVSSDLLSSNCIPAALPRLPSQLP